MGWDDTARNQNHSVQAIQYQVEKVTELARRSYFQYYLQGAATYSDIVKLNLREAKALCSCARAAPT